MNVIGRLVSCLCVLILATPLLAVPTQIHEDATAAAFRAGTPDGVVIAHSGWLRPGDRFTKIATEEAGVWSLALGGDGVLYAGTGNDGTILAVKGEDVSVVHETGSVLVAAMAAGPDGEIYAGTVPDGRVYRLERMASGLKVTLLSVLPDPNVWALDVDELGRVFAGTGPGGRVYRIAPHGQSEAILETGDANVLAVLVDGRGGLLVGTGGKGLLMHLAPLRDGYQTRVLHDFEEEEVRALVRAGGKFYAGVNRDRGGSDVGTVTGLVKAAADAAAAGGRRDPVPAADKVGQEESEEGSAKALLSGALHRIDLSGGTERVLTCPDSGISSLAADRSGAVLIAAGRGGRVFRFSPDTGSEVLGDLSADHAGALVVRDGALLAVGAANAGSIHRVDASGAVPSLYTSKVVDARFPAAFGALTVDSDARGLAVETRSGNTAEPDATWSPWRALRAPDPDRGEPAEGALRMASAPARFLQYRLRWPAGNRGVVRRVTLAYRCRNQRPRLSSATVAGGTSKDEPATPETGEDGKPGKPTRIQSSHGPIKTIRWSVDAIDGDTLVHAIAYRAVGEENWRPLKVDAKRLSETTYTWDTTSVPDGRYVVRVSVSDAPGNAEGALTDVAVTDPFLVDNRKPLVEISSFEASADGGILRGKVEDGFSRITGITISIDGGDWAPVAPRDHLLDEAVEHFVFRLPAGLTKGSHSVMIRATDEAGNTGVGGMTLRIEHRGRVR